MKRTTLALLLMAVWVWLGCGVDEEPSRPGASASAEPSPDLSKMSVEERKEATKNQDETFSKLFVWPEGQPGERDVLADSRACRERAVTQERYVRANDLVKFVILAECMQQKGWKPIESPPAQ